MDVSSGERVGVALLVCAGARNEALRLRLQHVLTRRWWDRHIRSRMVVLIIHTLCMSMVRMTHNGYGGWSMRFFIHKCSKTPTSRPQPSQSITMPLHRLDALTTGCLMEGNRGVPSFDRRLAVIVIIRVRLRSMSAPWVGFSAGVPTSDPRA